MMTEEQIKKLNIYEKLSLITDEIGVVEKNLNVGMGKNTYKAVSERDVLDNVKPIEKKYRVYSYPVKREILESDTLVKESEYNDTITRTNTLFMRVETTYRFVNIDKPDEYIETTTYGDGLDTGDKAPGKATTYSDKYALMKAYKLSTGDDPDKDASPEEGYKKAPKTTKTTTNKTLTPKQKEILLQKYTGDNLTKLLEVNNIKSIDELSMDKASQLISAIYGKKEEVNK